jgi:uncharacterized protein YecE (DUF72 family)
MIWVGTSGFQYAEWKGSFYPQNLATAKMLPYYAERFPTTEINYSFYRVPALKTLANWSAATPDRFRFTLKAPQQITHVRRLRNAEDVLGRFEEAVRSLGDKLGMILFQLPSSLKKDLPLLRDFLGSLPADLPSAFEFRHASWFGDETYEALREKNVAVCVAEAEKLAVPVVFTADRGYFRLRLETYADGDIDRWAALLDGQRGKLKDVFVYFKHEEAGTGPMLAQQLIEALDIGR